MAAMVEEAAGRGVADLVEAKLVVEGWVLLAAATAVVRREGGMLAGMEVGRAKVAVLPVGLEELVVPANPFQVGMVVLQEEQGAPLGVPDPFQVEMVVLQEEQGALLV